MRRHHGLLIAVLAALGPGVALANDPDRPRPADRQDQERAAEPAKNPAAERDSSQPVNDTWITTKVTSSLLADNDVSGLDIQVDTVDGVVYLSGTADTKAQADAAKRIAQGIDGVTGVDASALKVGGR